MPTRRLVESARDFRVGQPQRQLRQFRGDGAKLRSASDLLLPRYKRGARLTSGVVTVTQSGVQTRVGSEATALLSDVEFVGDWERLADACPWSTVYQMPGFALTWYRVYGDLYEPIVITLRDADGLNGLLLLARYGNEVVHVGAHHAEYQGWLATPESSPRFLPAAAHALRSMGVGELRLHMAAPKLPLDSLDALELLGIHATVRMHERGFMRVGRGNDIDASLRKKGNRSRVSRLSRNAPLELVQLTSRDELNEVFDTIIEQCDLRQGAMHNSMPFRADPRKREFYLALMEQPGLLHATVLRSGNRILAAHLGPIDREYVSLGVIAHSPTEAANSPGKLLLLLLGQRLGEQGFGVFDLTPGGQYKDRFADRHDEVPSVTLHLSSASYMRNRGRQIAVRSLRSAGEAVGFDARDAGERLVAISRRVARLTPRRLARTAAIISKRWAASTREFRVYAMSNADALMLDARSERFELNCMRDLLRYDQTAGEPDLQGFLRQSLDRLENGQSAFTCSTNGMLLHNSWLIPRTSSGGSEFGHRFFFARPASVLWADFTHPTARGRGLHQASLRARAWYAARHKLASVVAIGVRADNIASRHNIEKLGFEHVGSAFLRTKLGKEERWIEGDFLSIEPPTKAPAHAERKANVGDDMTREATESSNALAKRDDKLRKERERSERERIVQRANERVAWQNDRSRDDDDCRERDESPRM